MNSAPIYGVSPVKINFFIFPMRILIPFFIGRPARIAFYSDLSFFDFYFENFYNYQNVTNDDCPGFFL